MRGETHYKAKLTNDDVRLIRLMIAERGQVRAQLAQMSNKALAEKFGVTKRAIERIASGEGWAHVD